MAFMMAATPKAAAFGATPRRRRAVFSSRAALVEAPRPGGAHEGSYAIQLSSSQTRARTDEMQAETRAMARAIGATVYSPQLLADMYGSRPLKV